MTKELADIGFAQEFAKGLEDVTALLDGSPTTPPMDEALGCLQKLVSTAKAGVHLQSDAQQAAIAKFVGRMVASGWQKLGDKWRSVLNLTKELEALLKPDASRNTKKWIVLMCECAALNQLMTDAGPSLVDALVLPHAWQQTLQSVQTCHERFINAAKECNFFAKQPAAEAQEKDDGESGDEADDMAEWHSAMQVVEKAYDSIVQTVQRKVLSYFQEPHFRRGEGGSCLRGKGATSKWACKVDPKLESDT